jgi:hypothetical protein
MKCSSELMWTNGEADRAAVGDVDFKTRAARGSECVVLFGYLLFH